MVEFHQKCNKWGYANGEINLKYFYLFIDSPYLISMYIYIYIYIYTALSFLSGQFNWFCYILRF